MKKKEISIGFSPTEITPNEVRAKLKAYNEVTQSNVTLSDKVINHCFMKAEDLEKRSLPMDVPKFFEQTKGDISEWYGRTPELMLDRIRMFEHLKEVGGTAYFFGNAVGGVLIEKELASAIGVPVVYIP